MNLGAGEQWLWGAGDPRTEEDLGKWGSRVSALAWGPQVHRP